MKASDQGRMYAERIIAYQRGRYTDDAKYMERLVKAALAADELYLDARAGSTEEDFFDHMTRVLEREMGRLHEGERPEFPVYYDAQGREHESF